GGRPWPPPALRRYGPRRGTSKRWLPCRFSRGGSPHRSSPRRRAVRAHRWTRLLFLLSGKTSGRRQARCAPMTPEKERAALEERLQAKASKSRKRLGLLPDRRLGAPGADRAHSRHGGTSFS